MYGRHCKVSSCFPSVTAYQVQSFFFVCKCRKSCLPLCTHVSVLKLNYLLQSITYFWLSFPAAWLSQKCPPPPQHLHAVFHTHALRFLATPLEHEIMPLAFIGGPGWLGSLSQCQWDISSFKYRGVSPMASRGLSMPAFPLSSSPSSHDISPPRSGGWGREGREVAWWRIQRGVGVGVQKEGKEVGGLASQGDDEGECVWFGKWVAGICVSLGTTFFFFLYAHKQKNATHPPTQPCSLCKASLLAGIACKTPWYVLVVCGLALPLTSSSLNHDQFHLKHQPKTTFHRSGVQLARDQPLQST